MEIVSLIAVGTSVLRKLAQADFQAMTGTPTGTLVLSLLSAVPYLSNMLTFGVGRRELFESVVTEENPVDTISAPCRVLSWSAYQQWLTEEIADEAEDDEHVFVCRVSHFLSSHYSMQSYTL